MRKRGNPNPSPATRFGAERQPATHGRPRESRDRITRGFLLKFADSFEKYGEVVIDRVREEEPATYLKIAAALVPKEIEIKRPLEELDDGKLVAAIEALTAAMRETALTPSDDNADPLELRH